MKHAENVLKHYGVVGMKWGKRRSRSEIDNASTDAKGSFDVRAKAQTQGVKSLSNEEMRKAVNRMRLEQEFTKLSKQEKESAQGRGKKFITGLLGDVGKQQSRAILNDVATVKRQQLVAQALKK